jgi:hypothetical protein
MEQENCVMNYETSMLSRKPPGLRKCALRVRHDFRTGFMLQKLENREEEA